MLLGDDFPVEINLWHTTRRSRHREMRNLVDSPASPPLVLISPMATDRPPTPVLMLDNAQEDGEQNQQPDLQHDYFQQLTDANIQLINDSFSIRAQPSNRWATVEARRARNANQNNNLENRRSRRQENVGRGHLNQRQTNARRFVDSAPTNEWRRRFPQNSIASQNQNGSGRFGSNENRQTLPLPLYQSNNRQNSTYRTNSHSRFNVNRLRNCGRNESTAATNNNTNVNNTHAVDLLTENAPTYANPEV